MKSMPEHRLDVIEDFLFAYLKPEQRHEDAVEELAVLLNEAIESGEIAWFLRRCEADGQSMEVPFP